MAVEERIRGTRAILAPAVGERAAENVLRAARDHRHGGRRGPDRRRGGREHEPLEPAVRRRRHRHDPQRVARGSDPLQHDRRPALRELLGQHDSGLGDPLERLPATRHGSELLRHELGGMVAGLVRPREPHPRDDAAQLLGDRRRFLGRGVRLREQQPGTEREVAHGDVAAGGIACDVSTPVHRGELHEGGAALADRAVDLLLPEDLDLAVVETHGPARPSPVRPAQQVQGMLEIGRPDGRLVGQPHPHQRSQRQPGRREKAAQRRDQRPEVRAQDGRDDGGQAEHGEAAPDPDARAGPLHE